MRQVSFVSFTVFSQIKCSLFKIHDSWDVDIGTENYHIVE